MDEHSFAQCSPTYTTLKRASFQLTTSPLSLKTIAQLLEVSSTQTLLPPNPQILATFPTPPLSPSSTLVFTLFAPPRSSNEHTRFSPSLLTSIAVHFCSLYANFFLPPPFLLARLGASSFRTSRTVVKRTASLSSPTASLLKRSVESPPP